MTSGDDAEILLDPDRAAVAHSERGETATLDRLIADDFVLDHMTGDGDEQVIRERVFDVWQRRPDGWMMGTRHSICTVDTGLYWSILAEEDPP